MKKFSCRRVIISPVELKTVMNQTLNSSFKGGLMITLSQVLYRNQVHYKEFLYKVCKVNKSKLHHRSVKMIFSDQFQEYYTIFPIVIYFPQNSFLVENFNRKLEAFEAAGLINHWASAHMDTKYLNFRTTSTEPKRLNIEHLSETIQMLVGGLILSTTAFIGEFFLFYVRSVRLLKISKFKH